MLREGVVLGVGGMIAACGLSVVGVEASSDLTTVDGGSADTGVTRETDADASSESPSDALDEAAEVARPDATPDAEDAAGDAGCATLLDDTFDTFDTTKWLALGDAAWSSGAKAVVLTNGNNSGSITYKQSLTYTGTLTVDVTYAITQFASANEGMAIGWLTALNTRQGGGGLGCGLCGNGTTGVGVNAIYSSKVYVASSVDGNCGWNAGQTVASFPTGGTLRMVGTANAVALHLGSIVEQRTDVVAPKTGYLIVSASNTTGTTSHTSISEVKVTSCP